jgi:hypothetical protein
MQCYSCIFLCHFENKVLWNSFAQVDYCLFSLAEVLLHSNLLNCMGFLHSYLRKHTKKASPYHQACAHYILLLL